ncbi:MAG: hypothetical protein QXV17_11800, partial [Candidatus Micrarchaeaceae archaeon]
MPTIEEDILKALGYVPKSSCQPITTTPTSIRDRIFAILGYIPASQCIPITPITCPSGDVQAVNGQCPSGYTADPNNPGCCMPVTVTTTPITCPSGDVQAVNGQCPSGYTADPNNPGCCMPVTVTTTPITCPSGDVQAVNGQCPSGYTADPNNPGCCWTIGCPLADVQAVNGQCPFGYTADPYSPGCCKPTTSTEYAIYIVAGSGGSVSPSGTQLITSTSSPISVSAIPNSGYRFTNWAIDTSNAGTNNPISLSYSVLQGLGLTPSGYTLTANFTPITCPSGDVQAVNGQCPSGYTADPNNTGCCMPTTTTTQYIVTFTESGLPSGTSWSVSMEGTTNNAVAPNSISFNAPNGTYNYTINAVSGYAASTSSGTVTVNGANISQSISFTKTTSTSLNVSAGTGGTVSNPGTFTTRAIITTITEIATPNSGYQFSGWSLNGTILQSYNSPTLTLSNIVSSLVLFSTNTLQALFVPLLSLNMSVSPTGSGTVSPTSLSNITSTTSSTITATPNSGYQFSGWTLNGTPLSTITASSISLSSIFSLLTTGVNNLVANFTQVIATATLIVSAGTGGTVSNAGTYTLPPSGGVVSTQRVNIGAVTSPSISSKYYNAVFIESGLPSGTEWAVTFNNATKSSSSNTITFTVLGGTYQYTIEPISGYTANPSSGSLYLGGLTLDHTQNITFTTTTQTTSQYTINIVAGSGGSVSPTGNQTITSTSSPISVSATPNSGYQFTNWSINNINAGSNNPVLLSYSVLQKLGLTVGSYTLTANFTSTVTSSFVFTPQSNSGYQFSNWTLNGTDITTDAKSYTGYPSLSLTDVFSIIKLAATSWQGKTFNLEAIFKSVVSQFPSLNMSVSPAGSGTVTPTSLSNIISTTSSTITATPNSGYQFSGWTLNGTPLSSITASSISVSSIFSLLTTGVNNLVANFTKIIKTVLQFTANTGGTITNQNGSIDITNYLSNPKNALLNIVSTPNNGYYFDSFTLNGNNITSYNNTMSSISCISKVIKTAINQIKLSDLIQNFISYINIGATNILNANFAVLPWNITMNCPCQTDGSAQCSFNVTDINGNAMYAVPIFIKEIIDYGLKTNCYVGDSSQSFNTGKGLGTVVVYVYAVQNLNAYAKSNTIGIPCKSFSSVSTTGTTTPTTTTPTTTTPTTTTSSTGLQISNYALSYNKPYIIASGLVLYNGKTLTNQMVKIGF